MRSVIITILILFLFPVQNFGQEIQEYAIPQDFKKLIIQNLILEIRPNEQFKKKYKGYFLVLSISDDKKISTAIIESDERFSMQEIDETISSKLNEKFQNLGIEFPSGCLYVFPVLVVTNSYFEFEDNLEEGIMSVYPNIKFNDFDCIISDKVTIVKLTQRI
ncbi:hypothetical protein [Algoriphagus winogradskyi]|uniref:Uncharacterized protein n=1 Tax=Algoriphagus winogradskyi TaxID=237017 RepID=A0ABY1PBW0_9BACT|nr:hypothetical protein [Algoriphagus winogradskyi]SMP30071.1 hypothetical protein SAMN06265367_106248 [Algoriphagus winogradskyi]